MNAEIVPLWGIFILLICYGFYIWISTKKYGEVQTELVTYADNIHDRIIPLGESIQESNRVHADLADLMEELIDSHGAVQKMSPQVAPVITGSNPMEIVTNLFINHMMNKRAEHHGSKTQQEWNISESENYSQEEFEVLPDEETQNNESSSEDITTG